MICWTLSSTEKLVKKELESTNLSVLLACYISRRSIALSSTSVYMSLLIILPLIDQASQSKLQKHSLPLFCFGKTKSSQVELPFCVDYNSSLKYTSIWIQNNLQKQTACYEF
jgi:hypothetical protein